MGKGPLDSAANLRMHLAAREVIAGNPGDLARFIAGTENAGNRSSGHTNREALTHLAVREMPHSGKPDELLAAFGIDSAAIVRAATA